MKLKINKKKIITFAIVCIFILICFGGAYKFFSFDNFIRHREFLLKSVNENYLKSLLVYCIVYIGVVVSTVPIGGPMTSIGGFLFGYWPGTFYATIAGTIGSAVSFLIFRYFLGNYVQKKYGKRLESFNKNVVRYGGFYVFVVQLIGLIPFFVVNMLASFTKIRLPIFAIATCFAIIPTNFMYAYAGRKLGTANSFSDLVSGKAPLIFLVFGLFCILSFLINKYRNKKAK